MSQANRRKSEGTMEAIQTSTEVSRTSKRHEMMQGDNETVSEWIKRRWTDFRSGASRDVHQDVTGLPCQMAW